MRGGVVDAGGWIRPLTQAFCFNMLEVHALFRAGGERWIGLQLTRCLGPKSEGEGRFMVVMAPSPFSAVPSSSLLACHSPPASASS
jgi:hypothetical protein